MNTEQKHSDIFVKNTSEKQQWFVLYVKSRHEKKAAALLSEDGYRIYLPVQKKLKKWKYRNEWVEEPLFKSYVFIKIKRSQLYEVIQNTHVVSYVKFQGEPATVREQELLFIKRMLLNETSMEVINGDLKIGGEIIILTGHFAGLKGKVCEIRGKSSLVLQIKSLNTNIVVPMANIKPPKDTSSKIQEPF